MEERNHEILTLLCPRCERGLIHIRWQGGENRYKFWGSSRCTNLMCDYEFEFAKKGKSQMLTSHLVVREDGTVPETIIALIGMNPREHKVKEPEKLKELLMKEIAQSRYEGRHPTRVLLTSDWIDPCPKQICHRPLFRFHGLDVEVLFYTERKYPFQGIFVVE